MQRRQLGVLLPDLTTVKQETELKLILDNDTEIELDYAGSNPDGDMLLVGYDTDHADVLSVTVNLPHSDADRICAELGLARAL